jgi:hypothetical protein
MSSIKPLSLKYRFRFGVIFYVTLTLANCIVTSCVPYPHTSIRSPEITGRILDARTHAPIEDAKIFFPDHSRVRCLSGADGKFRLKATHNFHLGGIPPEGDWPKGEQYGAAIAITHPGYKDIIQRGPDDWRLADKGDIFLEPNP